MTRLITDWHTASATDRTVLKLQSAAVTILATACVALVKSMF